MKELDLVRAFQERRAFGVDDDFDWFISPHRWTKLAADTTPTVGVVSGSPGGILQLYTDAVNNNECAVYLTNEIFKFAAAKPLRYETSMQFTEASTSAMNCCFGFASSIGADLMVDDGAGPKTSFTGAMIYKVDGGTVWKFITSVSTTQTTSTSIITAGGSSYQTLRIELKPVTSTQYEAVPFVDGKQLIDSNNKPIKHTFTLGSTAFGCGAYAKAGSGSAETLLVDYIKAYQLR